MMPGLPLTSTPARAHSGDSAQSSVPECMYPRLTEWAEHAATLLRDTYFGR